MKNKKIKLWLPVLIWAGIIYSFSSMSINKEAEFNWLDFVIKKSAHVTEYAILFWLLFRAMSGDNKNLTKKIFIKVFIFTVVYALSDEWHQTFVPGREGTLRDVGFDTIGALISLNLKKRNI
ncbi:MAG: VanZ family protein [Candidatus Beckwithbacteria bacterium]|nr:VanZ family protein [Patescibacteria group bacterium]